MGYLVARITATPKRVGFTDVHTMLSVYKPTGRFATDDEWHRRYVAPSERAWAKKPLSDQMNVLVIHGERVEEGTEVHEMPFYNGCKKLFTADLEGYPVVGRVERDARGKLFVHFN